MGGVIAADVATYYGTNLIRGVVLMGSFPHRNMHTEVATQWVLDFIPRLLDPDLAKFGPTAKEFAESCVAFGDKLDQGTKYSWMGAVAGQNPDVRVWSIPHTQNETALMKASKTLPYLVLHGKMDKHVDGLKLKAFMQKYFGNYVFRLWDNVGHASFWDAPADANKEIIAFAKRLDKVSIHFAFILKTRRLTLVHRAGLPSAARLMVKSSLLVPVAPATLHPTKWILRLIILYPYNYPLDAYGLMCFLDGLFGLSLHSSYYHPRTYDTSPLIVLALSPV